MNENISFVHGNMFNYQYDIRINTVNCVGVMGKGIALQFKQEYPKMFDRYKVLCESGKIRPGILHIWRTKTEHIINFPTKDHWRDPSKLEYIEKGLKSLQEYLNTIPPATIAIPPLGCGNGGLYWPQVKPYITSYLCFCEHDIDVYQPPGFIDS